jgi:hypothetical protein
VFRSGNTVFQKPRVDHIRASVAHVPWRVLGDDRLGDEFLDRPVDRAKGQFNEVDNLALIEMPDPTARVGMPPHRGKDLEGVSRQSAFELGRDEREGEAHGSPPSRRAFSPRRRAAS